MNSEFFKEKKQQLVGEFNRNQQTIQQLTNRQQQIIGQLNLIQDFEKEKKETVEEKK